MCKAVTCLTTHHTGGFLSSGQSSKSRWLKAIFCRFCSAAQQVWVRTGHTLHRSKAQQKEALDSAAAPKLWSQLADSPCQR